MGCPGFAILTLPSVLPLSPPPPPALGGMKHGQAAQVPGPWLSFYGNSVPWSVLMVLQKVFIVEKAHILGAGSNGH